MMFAAANETLQSSPELRHWSSLPEWTSMLRCLMLPGAPVRWVWTSCGPAVMMGRLQFAWDLIRPPFHLPSSYLRSTLCGNTELIYPFLHNPFKELQMINYCWNCSLHKDIQIIYRLLN